MRGGLPLPCPHSHRRALHPPVVHFGGYQLHEIHTQYLRVINISSMNGIHSGSPSRGALYRCSNKSSHSASTAARTKAFGASTRRENTLAVRSARRRGFWAKGERHVAAHCAVDPVKGAGESEPRRRRRRCSEGMGGAERPLPVSDDASAAYRAEKSPATRHLS